VGNIAQRAPGLVFGHVQEQLAIQDAARGLGLRLVQAVAVARHAFDGVQQQQCVHLLDLGLGLAIPSRARNELDAIEARAEAAAGAMAHVGVTVASALTVFTP